MKNGKKSLSRREFLQRLGIGTTGAIFAVYAGKQVWVSALAPDDPTEDPRNIDNAKEIPSPKYADSQSESRTALSDGTVVDQSMYPEWPDKNIVIRQTGEGNFLAWTLGSNPVWIWGGEEAEDLPHNGIRWSQPEIAAFSDDEAEAIRYTNITETSAGLSMTKTAGDALLAHSVPSTISTGLWMQRDRGALIKDGLILEAIEPTETEFSLPRMTQSFSGYTIESWVKVSKAALIMRTSDYSLSYDGETRTFILNWGYQTAQSAPKDYDDGNWHHLSVIVDAGPQTICWVIDGQFSWTYLPNEINSPSGANTLHLPPTSTIDVATLRIYERALRNAECVSSYHFYGQGMGIFDYI